MPEPALPGADLAALVPAMAEPALPGADLAAMVAGDG
jgi:hypothetical protein